MIEYELRRSRRRTLSIEVNREAKLIVRAPLKMPLYRIESFVASHKAWIEEKQKKVLQNKLPEPTDAEIELLKQQAKDTLVPLTEYYAKIMGVEYTDVGITGAKTRYGSCSKKGSINYSRRVMLQQRETWDYIVVHELCHLIHFNHSKEFWQTVEKYLPDYKNRKAKLK